MKRVLLKLWPLEARILRKGPMRFRWGIIDGRLEDGICVNAGKHLAGTAHSK